jgi:hypothetical protein
VAVGPSSSTLSRLGSVSVWVKLSLLLLVAVLGCLAHAQERPQAMIVGTFHFGSTPDAFSSPLHDVQEAHRQREIDSVVRALAEFNPTRIAVEALPGAAYLEEGLAKYLGGGALGQNEIDQIAFRMAKLLGHNKVHGVNYHLDANPMPVLEWAFKHGQAEIAGRLGAEFQEKVLPRLQPEYLRGKTVADILVEMNEPETMLLEHRLLAQILQIGNTEEPVGGELLAKTASRNTMIASHIQRLAGAGERVFVLIGSSYRLPLERILADGGDVEIIDPLPFLRKAKQN